MKLKSILGIGLITSSLILSQMFISKAEDRMDNTDTQISTINTKSKVKNGWVKAIDSYTNKLEWYYYKNDKMLESQWIKDNGKWYYLDMRGRMVSNDFYDVSYNKYYLFAEDGSLIEKEGWAKVDGYWYYCNKDGTIRREQWINQNNTKYYVNSFGRMCKNETAKTGGRCYAFGTNGELITKKGWIKLGDKWVYGYGDGALAYNIIMDIDNKKYYFNHSGYMECDYVWTEQSEIAYYFGKNGEMSNVKGWINVKGYWHYGNGDGTLKVNEWIKDKDKWYYFNSISYMVRNNICKINDKIYGFNPDGSMVNKSGWTILGLTKYYCNSNGTIKCNEWVKENGKWYYLTSYGDMAIGEDLYINGKVYKFNYDGVCLNP